MARRNKKFAVEPGTLIAWIALFIVIIWLGANWSSVDRSSVNRSSVNTEKKAIKVSGDSVSYAKIVADTVNVRSAPEIDKENIIGIVEKGDTVQVIEKTSDWFRVQLKDEKTGYVSAKSEYIQLVDE